MAKRKPTNRRRYERRLPEGAVHQDPAGGIDAPPNFGRQVMPHTITFSSLIGTVSKAYKNPDEAVLHSLENARWMRNSLGVMECLEARQRGTALLNWHLEPEDTKDAAQVALCERLTKIMLEIPDFTEYRRNLLEALWYGRYAIQHAYGFDWRTGKKRVLIKSWRPIHGDKLIFRYDDGTGKFDPNQIGLRVGTQYNKNDALAGDRKLETTDQGLGYFLEPWERSLMAVHRHMIEDAPFESAIHAGAIHGVGIRSRIYWTWFQMQEVQRMLMEFLQRSAQGIWIYFYPAGNPQAKTEMEAVAKQQTDTNILVMPRMPGDPAMDAFGVDRVEVSPAGGEALKAILNDYFGHQIKRYILGQTLTTEADATGLGSGVADLHLESFLQIVRYDAAKLEETMTRELVEPLKNYNEPDFRNVLIRFKIDTEAAETDKRLDAIKAIWDMGAKIKTEEVMALVGFSKPGPGDDVLCNPQLVQPEQMQAGGQPGAAAAPEPSMPAEIEQHLEQQLGETAAPESVAAAAGTAEGDEPPKPSGTHHITVALGGAGIERGDDFEANVRNLLEKKGLVRKFAKFDESQHPRKGDGEFAPKGGAEASGKSSLSPAKREGKGKEARILLSDGKSAPDWIKPSMVPPQWTDVHIATDKGADVLVRARDAKGRIKTVYSDNFTMRQAAAKFARVSELVAKHRAIADQNQMNRKNAAMRDNADCLWLIQEQGTRPGSDSDTKAKVKAYGATTLRAEHVEQDDDGTVRLHFIGKEGVEHNHRVRNPELAKMLLARKQSSEARGGKLFDTSDTALRDYTRSLDGGAFTPKDFRTAKATILAVDEMKKLGGCCRDKKEYKAAVKTVATAVSSVLGNRPQQAVESYINPTVWSAWRCPDCA